jgi:hypothetical protein
VIAKIEIMQLFYSKVQVVLWYLPGKYKDFKAGTVNQGNNNLEVNSYQDENDGKMPTTDTIDKSPHG